MFPTMNGRYKLVGRVPVPVADLKQIAAGDESAHPGQLMG
jgi:hypothetical protein